MSLMNKALVCGWALSVCVSAGAKVQSCTATEKSEISMSYENFRNASRAGDLAKVQIWSTSDVARQISEFEKTSGDKAALARQMGGVSPALADALGVTCETAGKKARLIVKTETRSGDKKSVVADVFSVVMFERQNGSWRVGVKASTSPFQTQSVDTLLVHQELRLP